MTQVHCNNSEGSPNILAVHNKSNADVGAFQCTNATVFSILLFPELCTGIRLHIYKDRTKRQKHYMNEKNNDAVIPLIPWVGGATITLHAEWAYC